MLPRRPPRRCRRRPRPQRDLAPAPQTSLAAGKAHDEAVGDGGGDGGPHVAELGQKAAGDGAVAVDPEGDAVQARHVVGGEGVPEGGAVEVEEVGGVAAQGDVEGVDAAEEGGEVGCGAAAGGCFGMCRCCSQLAIGIVCVFGGVGRIGCGG